MASESKALTPLSLAARRAGLARLVGMGVEVVPEALAVTLVGVAVI
jgi:hypothetical protein